MAYIGKQPTVGNFVKLDAITTSATATYNLLNGGVAYSPQSANHCIVSLNGVIQEPTSASNVGGFTISGSTIVFTSALTSSDVIDFILVLGDVLNIGTPSDATVGFSKVTSNLITGATAETTIAGGDSVLIYDDSASALRKMTRTNFVSGIGGANTPAFFAFRSTSQTIPNTTFTKMQFNSEKFDTDNAFDSTTDYRFTVPTGQGGKYLITVQAAMGALLGMMYLRLYVNGSAVNYSYGYMSGNTDNSISQTLIRDLSAGDYIEYYIYHDDGGNLTLDTSETNYFGAFKLIGV